MKWDVKHDIAKGIIDGCLNAAGNWQTDEALAGTLNEEERKLVDEEVALMIASIRKRYKLQVRLPEQPDVEEEQKDPEPEQAKEPEVEKPAEEAKPKRTRKTSHRKLKRYEYGMRLRGFSIGCQPDKGFLDVKDDPEGKYHSIIAYSRKLTKKELADYELDLIGEVK